MCVKVFKSNLSFTTCAGGSLSVCLKVQSVKGYRTVNMPYFSAFCLNVWLMGGYKMSSFYLHKHPNKRHPPPRGNLPNNHTELNVHARS